jgi:hypothetical protein
MDRRRNIFIKISFFLVEVKVMSLKEVRETAASLLLFLEGNRCSSQDASREIRHFVEQIVAHLWRFFTTKSCPTLIIHFCTGAKQACGFCGTYFLPSLKKFHLIISSQQLTQLLACSCIRATCQDLQVCNGIFLEISGFFLNLNCAHFSWRCHAVIQEGHMNST